MSLYIMQYVSVFQGICLCSLRNMSLYFKEYVEKILLYLGKDRNGNADPNLPPILTKKGKLELKDMLSKGAAAKLKQDIEEKQRKQDERGKKKGKKSKKNKERRRKREVDWYQENEDVIQILMTNDLQFFNRYVYVYIILLLQQLLLHYLFFQSF